MTEQKDTGLAALTHILALFTWIIGPLLVYLITDDEYVKENAANALNWQISFSIYMVISFILLFVLIGILLLAIFSVMNLVVCIMAALKASDGEAWSYPLALPIL